MIHRYILSLYLFSFSIFWFIGNSQSRIRSTFLNQTVAALDHSETTYDFYSDSNWPTHDFWVGVNNESGNPNFVHFQWDPHFLSMTDSILSFCYINHGCDLNSKLLIRKELIRRFNEATQRGYEDLHRILQSMILKKLPHKNAQHIGQHWLDQSDETIREQHNKKSALLQSLMQGILLPPKGSCLSPTNVEISIGACPLYLAQEVLSKHPHVATRNEIVNDHGTIENDTENDLEEDEKKKEEMTQYSVPSSPQGWLMVAEAWFNAGEYALATAVWLFLTKELQEQQSSYGIKNEIEKESVQPQNQKLWNKEAGVEFVSQQGLGTVAAAWGLDNTSAHILLGATFFAEDPLFLLASHSLEEHQFLDHVEHREALIRLEFGLNQTSSSEGDDDQWMMLMSQSLLKELLTWRSCCSASSAHALRVKAALFIPPIIGHTTQSIAHHRQRLFQAANKFASVSSPTSIVLKLPVKVSDPCVEIGVTFFHLAHQGLNDKRLNRAIGRALLAISPSLQYISPFLLAPQHQRADRTTMTEFKLGVVSNHMYEHSIGKMLAAVLLGLRHRGVSIHLCDQIPAGSGRDDRVRQFLLAHVVEQNYQLGYTELPKDLPGCATAVASLQLDVLLYPDIGMESLSYFLSFARLAPVQVVWWGHPDTTPGTQIDYFLSLDDEVDSASSHYHEQLVRVEILNSAVFHYDPLPVHTDGDTREVVEGRDTVFTFGLSLVSPHDDIDSLERPEVVPTPHLFLVLGRLFKLHPSFDRIMIEVLFKDPLSVIVLIQERQQPLTQDIHHRILSIVEEVVNSNHKKEMNQLYQCDLKGRQVFIDDDVTSLHHPYRFCSVHEIVTIISRRIRFISHWNYLRVLSLPELFAVLDTWPYGGCLTALEALSHGRPVVTLPSLLVRGRFALAMYRQMGILPHNAPSFSSRDFGHDAYHEDRAPPSPFLEGSEHWGLVAIDEKDYVKAVVKIGRNPEHRLFLTNLIREKYEAIHKNDLAAHEWGMLFQRLA